jgi:hypothetical protein
MRDHTKLRAFELADEVAVLRELHYQLSLSKRLGFLRNQDSSLIEPKIVETEKVLNGLIRALRDD